MRRIVDLPHPEGPSSATKAPAGAPKDTLSSAVMVDRPIRNCLVRPRRAIPSSTGLVAAAAGTSVGVSGSADGETFVTSNAEGRVSAGTHGFIATLAKMNAVCVISGAGVKQGARLQNVENIDIAPTAAHILEVKFEATGRVLSEALR